MMGLMGIAILVPERTYAQITVTRSIAASSDDAEEAGPDATGTHLPGHMDRTSTDIELVRDQDGTGGYSGGTQKIGLRFTALSIPPGSIITSAYLTFRAVAADVPMSNAEATNLTIRGHLSPNAPTFPGTIGDISARALSASSVSWVPTAWITGTDINTPSILPVIQEIVGQGGWASGNAIAIIITGAGHRASQAYDTDPATAARLTVTYATYQISGTVFEDGNYGGGAGRNLATATGAGGTGRSGARVELFDNGGNYVTFTTTAAGGTYSFSGLAPGSYTVRVVNSSVSSARTGYLVGTHLAVQTYRTNASTGSAVATTNVVGGEVPNKADAGNGGTTLAALTTGTTAPQSVTSVTIGSSDVTGVDFGYSFSVVCNRNNAGQGSLRQFITNANALSNTGLAIQGRTAGIDHAMFMLADGTNTYAGMNSSYPNLFSGGVATITAASALPDITQPVVIDAQTQPGFVSTPKFELNGNNVAGALKGFRLIAGSTGSTIEGFIINRWTGHGIEVNGSNDHVIAGNWLGLGATGLVASPNAQNGIRLINSTGVLIGGTSVQSRNVISGNSQQGIFGDNLDNSVISGNYVGTDANGTGDVNGTTANTLLTGVFLTNGSSNNVIGGTTPGSGNVMSGNNHFGFEVLFGSQNNLVQGNYIGTDATGLVALGNVNGGAAFWNAGTGNVFGGGIAAARNVIAGNLFNGVLVGNATTGAIIQGNYIGLGADGIIALGNGSAGVKVEGGSTNTLIGTDANGTNDVAERNVICSNTYGISLSDAGTNNTRIAGNYIGLAADGTTTRGNSSSGVHIASGSTTTTLGGATSVSRNIIASNASFGVYIGGASTGNSVLNNYIGTTASGNAARPNLDGIWIDGCANNTLGLPGAGNLISGNTYHGVVLDLAGSTGNTVQANLVGTDGTGSLNLANGGHGVQISGGSNNAVGGTMAGMGNTIAFNDGDGISISAGTGNSLLGNSIHSNTDLGIDLANNGVSPNDPTAGMDSDGGANTLQNFPALSSAIADTVLITTAITGTLNSSATTTFRIEFFSSSAQDPSGYGEGVSYLGATSVLTDALGNASIGTTLPIAVSAGHYVTATATNTSANNTSEFSAARLVSIAPTAVCQNITADLNAAGSATITAAMVNNGSYDTDGSIVSMSVAPNTFNCGNIGVNNVTLTVTDNSGLTATCSAVVTVRDALAPVMTCPADIVVQVDQGVTSAVATYTAPTATDNCGSPVVSRFSGNASGSSFPLGNSIVVYQAVDAAGNVTRCGFNVTVMTCPADIVLPAQPGLCGSTATWSDLTMIYNEGFEGPATGLGGTGWNAANSSVTRVTSGTNGITSAGGAYHLSIDPAASPTTGAFTRLGGSRKCFGGGFSASMDVYMDLSDPRVIANTYGWDNTGAIHDNNGMYLRDFIFHTASNASGHILVGAGNNTGGTRRTDLAMFANYEITSSGWYTFKRIYRAQAGALAVDFEVRNAGGSLLWTTTLSNPADLIANVGGNRSLWFIFLETGKLAVDNCRVTYNNESESIDHASGSFFPVGSTTVTNTSTTPCGTVLTCAFQVVVNDTQAPAISCPANISVGSGPGICGAVVSYGVPVGTDNCAGVTTTRTAGPATGSVFPPGTTTVTYRATDAPGNFTTCSFTVTVTPTDYDGDGVCDNVDLDDDNDGIPDTAEGGAALDTDGDGVPNRFDLDSDNDGIYDCVESGAAQAFTAGVLNGAVTANGIPVSVDANANGVVDYTIRDSDADSTIDSLELDADADGCTDVIEAGYIDTNGDGVPGNAPVTVNGNGLVTSLAP
jgi:hypothetical protein